MPNTTIETFIETRLGVNINSNPQATVALVGTSQLEVFMEHIVQECRQVVCKHLCDRDQELMTELDTTIYLHFKT